MRRYYGWTDAEWDALPALTRQRYRLALGRMRSEDLGRLEPMGAYHEAAHSSHGSTVSDADRGTPAGLAAFGVQVRTEVAA